MQNELSKSYYYTFNCSETDLIVESLNIAIPTSFIVKREEGGLELTLYVQVSDGFLSKEQLKNALEVICITDLLDITDDAFFHILQLGEPQYRDSFPPATTTGMPTTTASDMFTTTEAAKKTRLSGM